MSVARTVYAQQGDTLDLLVFRHVGNTSGGIVEKTLSLNRGLCELGVILPTGTAVVLPEQTKEQAANVKKIIQLWD